MDEIYTFLVRGPASRLPRGYLWLVPIWLAVIGAAVALGLRHFNNPVPVWLLGTEVGGLALGGVILLGVLLTIRHHALRANRTGIWLGVSTTRKRPRMRQVHIPWADIYQLRMASRRYGVLLEIALGPAARIVARPGPGRQALMLLGMLVMPFGFGRGRPALTAARSDPPRYLVKVCDVTPAELRQMLGSVKPPEVPLRIATKAAALRYATVPGRRTGAQPTSVTIPP